MAKITASMVKELREKTAAGMMDCKKALTAVDGDFDKAINWLRENGKATAAKKAGRVTTEGMVQGVLAEDRRTGAMVEVNIETDFAVKNPDFQALVTNLTQQALATETEKCCEEFAAELKEKPYIAKPEMTVAQAIEEEVASIRENISFRRAVRYTMDGSGIVDVYIHGGGRIGVLMAMATGKEETAANAKLQSFVRNLSLQVASMSPLYLNQDVVPQEVLDNELEIARAAARKEGKPEKIIDNIAQGKLKKYFSEFCLMEQNYILDDKQSVAAVMKALGKELNDTLEIKRFVRFERGEGLEKKQEDFAAEVAAQLK